MYIKDFFDYFSPLDFCYVYPNFHPMLYLHASLLATVYLLRSLYDFWHIQTHSRSHALWSAVSSLNVAVFWKVVVWFGEKTMLLSNLKRIEESTEQLRTKIQHLSPEGPWIWTSSRQKTLDMGLGFLRERSQVTFGVWCKDWDLKSFFLNVLFSVKQTVMTQPNVTHVEILFSTVHIGFYFLFNV